MFDSFLDLFGIDDLSDDIDLDPGPDIADSLGSAPMGSDILTQELDINGDGIVDGILAVQDLDLNGDGIIDATMWQQQLDTNGDGYIDTIQTDIPQDTNGDGIVDYQYTTVEMDTNGDGIIDYTTVAEDFDGDGLFDSVSEWMDTNGDGQLEPMTMDESGSVYDYNFDPAQSDSDSVIGDPAEAMEAWHPQESQNSCAVASQEFILETLTGKEFEESDLCDLAEENGWYTPEGGTLAYDTGNILEAMGMRVERSEFNTISDIEECLQNGGEVIVGVDSSELWEGPDHEMFGPGMQADHAVQVIGIDYSNPSQPRVILNDSGVADGCGAMVPMDVFIDAWQDSNCFMVEAYAQ